MEESKIDIVWKSRYIPRSSEPVRPITFRNMIYWRSSKDKIELFGIWLKQYIKGEDRIGFNKWLDKPREMVTEWSYIRIGEPTDIYIDVKPKPFNFKDGEG